MPLPEGNRYYMPPPTRKVPLVEPVAEQGTFEKQAQQADPQRSCRDRLLSLLLLFNLFGRAGTRARNVELEGENMPEQPQSSIAHQAGMHGTEEQPASSSSEAPSTFAGVVAARPTDTEYEKSFVD